MGGFFGATGGEKIDKKRELLKEEGVIFDMNGDVKTGCVHNFDDVEEKDENVTKMVKKRKTM